MNIQVLKTVSTRAATVVGAVAITAVVVSGSLSVAQAATEAVANNSVNSAKIVTTRSRASTSGTAPSPASTSPTGPSPPATSPTRRSPPATSRSNTIGGSDIADDRSPTARSGDGSIIGPDIASGLLPRFAHVDGGSTTVTMLDSTAFSGANVARTGAGVYAVAFAGDVSNCGTTAGRGPTR